MREVLRYDNREVVLLGEPSEPVWVFEPVNVQQYDLLEEQLAKVHAEGGRCFLVALLIEDWNRELSPWEAPAAFGTQDFGNGAGDLLSFLTGRLMPDLRERFAAGEDKQFFLAGYSLAGLFALWAGYQTDVFFAVAGVSPSVWFPDWTAYIRGRQMRAQWVYLSLGEREHRTKNRQMATVKDAIESQYQALCQIRTPCMLEQNPGNHFQDSEKRMARGISAMLAALGLKKYELERKAKCY